MTLTSPRRCSLSGHSPPQLRVATYNIHGGVGLDRRYDPQRIARVLRELAADVVALQEVDSRRQGAGSTSPLVFLAQETGMVPISGPTLSDERGEYGNALLAAQAPSQVLRHRLPASRREPRGVLEAHWCTTDYPWRILVTHFGLDYVERRRQAAALLELVAARPRLLTLVAGDFNEWYPCSRTLRLLGDRLGSVTAPPSYPSCWPLLRLDRIWCSPSRAVSGLDTHRTPSSRCASDHLPVVAQVTLATPARSET